MHLRGAGIGEADINAARYQGPHQTFRSVHTFRSRSRRFLDTVKINHSAPLSSKD
jgi:hypothetical protein